jgi:hypothetical protein
MARESAWLSRPSIGGPIAPTRPAVWLRCAGATRQLNRADLDVSWGRFPFEPALAFKVILIRQTGAQGGVGERDTFGAQQYAALLDIAAPD